MEEQDQSEKTEEPTARRLEKAAEEGQVLSSKEVFKYYIDHNIEEVILFLKKKKDVYKVTYRVFPSYLDDRQNISKLHERVHKDLLLLSLKDSLKSLLVINIGD